MSIALKSTDQSGNPVDFIGHDYRLTDDQYRRTIAAGIIDEADEVGLQGGYLCWMPNPGDLHHEGHYRLSLDQYRAMARLGILTTDDRIELLEGWLIAKMSKNRPHTVSKGLTCDALRMILPAGWFLAIEDPATAIDSEPEPDLSIVRGSYRDYSEQTPGPQQVALLIEVADSSLFRDRMAKKRLYARAGFFTYWLINLVDHRIEVYTEPTGPIEEPDYLRRQDFGPDEMIPLIIESREVGRLAVRDLLR